MPGIDHLFKHEGSNRGAETTVTRDEACCLYPDSASAPKVSVSSAGGYVGRLAACSASQIAPGMIPVDEDQMPSHRAEASDRLSDNHRAR